MAGLSMKEIARIIEYVEPQGVAVTRTKKGLLLRLPNGKSEMIHFTSSDHRAYENNRSRLHQAGIELPMDKYALKKLPDYITAGSMRQTTLDRAARVIADMGSPRQVTAVEFMEAGGAPTHGLANRTLYHLGYLPQTDRKGAHKVWMQPMEQDEEPMTEEQLLERVSANASRQPIEWHGQKGSVAARIYTVLAERGEPMTQKQLSLALPDANPSTISSSVANMKKRGLVTMVSFGFYALPSVAERPEPEPERDQTFPVDTDSGDFDQETEDIVQREVHTGIHGHVGDREFIDSVNSWALDLSLLDHGLTLGSIKDLLRAAALDFEVRVWHANENTP